MKSTASKTAAPSKSDLPVASAKKSILLVDDHPLMRAGLAQLINKQPDMIVSAEADDPIQATRELSKAMVDLVLTDLTMPGRGGIEFIKDLRVLYPELLILVVSMHDEMLYAERALRAGARGYIMKEAGGEKLVAAIRQVLAGQVYTSPRMNTKIVESFSAQKPRGSNSPIETLSDREFEVFQLIGAGKGTHEIAKQLRLSSKTVDVHRSHIKEKLAIPDNPSLIHYAVRWIESNANP
jgi:DNA-binding NarL/FixJ family response regulator